MSGNCMPDTLRSSRLGLPAAFHLLWAEVLHIPSSSPFPWRRSSCHYWENRRPTGHRSHSSLGICCCCTAGSSPCPSGHSTCHFQVSRRSFGSHYSTPHAACCRPNFLSSSIHGAQAKLKPLPERPLSLAVVQAWQVWQESLLGSYAAAR